MISGETEQLLRNDLEAEDYDAFLGNKKKRRARRAKRKARRRAKRMAKQSNPARIERRVKRSTFFKDAGQIYRDAGSATGIGSAIDAITRQPLPPNYGGLGQPSDFSIGLGTPDEPDEEKKGIPTVIYILGGVVVVGVIGLVISSSKKNKQY